MTAEAPSAGTVLQALVAVLARTSEYNAQDQAAPAAILWTDREGQWQPVIQRLSSTLPQFLTFGAYTPDRRTGPAIWIRCMIERTLPEATWPSDVIPVIYLPGVSRHELRAVEECPRELQPLAELQYHGVWFTQENTKDWTVFAFLTSKRGGLALDVAGDGATRETVRHALTKLADTPLAELRGRRLHVADFQALLQPDLVKQLLRWLDVPAATRQAWTAAEWQAFRGACRDRYGFDPETDGELVGAERLGRKERGWDAVWNRFAEAPEAYPNLPDLLRRAKPTEEGPPLFFYGECWPQVNEKAEDDLRDKLVQLAASAPSAAATEIEKLELSHAPRRRWVWAKLGRAPLASALGHLAELIRATRTRVAGEDITAMAIAYATDGWRADAAVIDALAVVSKSADVAAVKAAIQSTYRPWLESGAERFQDRVRETATTPYTAAPSALTEAGPGTCVVFADGLRLDLGKRLRVALEGAGFVVDEGWRWVPLPPVTPTAKPMASPVADLVTGQGANGEQFQPCVRETGQPLTIERFRDLMAERGFQDLRGDDTGDPVGRAWTEHGEIDQRGHEEGWKLARRVAEEISGLVDRVRSLLDAGWREVRVVTDHGWLLVPGGLPKVEMPHYLVESRWTRCGTLRPGARVELPTAPWHWNADVQIAFAPGIGSFRANTEYSHGSLSLQECVVPDLVVRAAVPRGPVATVQSVRWTGLRCRVRVGGAMTGWQVDLRTKAGDASSSLAAEARPVGHDGDATFVVDNPDHEGRAATVVLLDSEGRVAAKHNTTVGGDA